MSKTYILNSHSHSNATSWKVLANLLLLGEETLACLIVPTDDCARTVGTNAIAKVNLPLKLKLLIGALRYIFTFL